MVLAGPVQEIWIRNGKFGELIGAGVQGDQAVRLRVGHGIQKPAVNHREQRRIGANADGQSQDRNHRKAWRFTQRAHTVSHVLPEMVQPEPTMGFVKMFPGVHNVAEDASRRSARLFLTQPEFSLALDLQLQVRVNLGAKVIRLAFASEHGFNLPPVLTPESGQWLSPISSTLRFLFPVVCGPRRLAYRNEPCGY